MEQEDLKSDEESEERKEKVQIKKQKMSSRATMDLMEIPGRDKS